LEGFRRAVDTRFPSASWTRYLQLHSAWIKVAKQSTVTLHYWLGMTSLWLSGDAAEMWSNSDEFAELRKQAADFAAQSTQQRK